ncbi:MAG: sulfatase-like hydrolase/transferase, partial [Nitrospinaceae bacterium]|nr:sulfatase-like hydrolase/transferase [Nitrospinaceae bacterium]
MEKPIKKSLESAIWNCAKTCAFLCGSMAVMTTVIGAEAKPLKDSKPNIIVIMPDDSGYGNYSCFGNPVIKTPNIDSLKKQSLLLTRYHSSARCSPSRAKLLSGRHEFLGGVTHTIQGRERLSLDTITLPQALKTAGYATGMFGKWHNGKEGP